MSQLNFTAHNEPENQLHHRNVKQFAASDISRSTKKTALLDVKNILAQRTVLSAKKPLTSVTKSSTSKKNLFNVFSDKENHSNKKEINLRKAIEAPTCSGSVLMNEADCDVQIEPACSYCNKDEDDYADILMQNLTLSKSEIDRLALEWERKPVVRVEDMRKLEIPAAVPDVMDSYDLLQCDHEHYEPDMSLLNDIPCVESVFNYSFEE